MNQTELLAPAGNYEALTGALSAGADAIYLGGSAFGREHMQITFLRKKSAKGSVMPIPSRRKYILLSIHW